MATRKVSKTSHDLPPANLYLEDIEEIVAAIGGSADAPARFLIGDVEYDSIEDLKKRGGSTIKLQIRVKAGPGNYEKDLHIKRMDAYFFEREGFDQVYLIFNRNARWWSNAIRSMPSWLGITAWMFVVSMGPVFSAQPLVHRFPGVSTVLLILNFAIILGAVSAYVWHTKVRLRYSYDPGSSEWLHKHGPQVLIALIAAIAGAAIKAVIDHFWK